MAELTRLPSAGGCLQPAAARHAASRKPDSLPLKEFVLLEMLLRNAGRVLTRPAARPGLGQRLEVQRILGHSTPATTLNLYTYLLPDAFDGAAARLDEYLGAEAVVAELVTEPPTSCREGGP